MRTQAEISEIMRRVKSRDTDPEMRLRRAVWRRGHRYRACSAELPGKPDLVFPAAKLAVFVDGDFWHGNQWRSRGLPSVESQLEHVRNADYWIPKIQANIRRDFVNTRRLLEAGWRVLRLWESQVRRDLPGSVETVLRAINGQSRRTSLSYLPALTVAEFFSGIGLVRLAFESSGWRVIFANDIDPDKTEMYKANFGDAELVRGDVHSIQPDVVPSCALYTASFPCNDLSLAGSMAGLNGKQSGAYWGLIRILKGKRAQDRPALILLENVPGFLASRKGKDFETALRALNDLEYSCDAFFLDAVNFVPQSRRRLFVVAKKDLDCPGQVTSNRSCLRPKALTDFINAHPNIRWHVWPLPDPPEQNTRIESVLEDLPDDSPEWWSNERAAYFLGQMSKRHSEVAKKMIAGSDYSFGTAFRRVRHGKSMAELRVDGIAGCLRTPRGGSGRQILFKAGRGKYRVRLLTPRECARLQGVPDSYDIVGTFNGGLFAFGDAVCVPAIQWIADNYLTPAACAMMRGRILVPANKSMGADRP